LLLGPALLLVACSSPARPSPSATTAPDASFTGTPVATTAVGAPSPSLGPQASGPIAVDETLLRFLPASVGSINVVYSAEATQSVLNDATLARSASALVYGIALDPTTNDVVVSAVVKLRPGVFNDAFYRTWRTTYDRAACGPAGGAAGSAEATIAGRLVYIGSCQGGAHTYHVYLDVAGVMVSATSVGAKRFGEQLIGSLRA
jgi:hypothetical protein